MMTQTNTHRRLPWIAVALSFLSIGVGHIYCGKIAKGLVLYFAWFAIPVLGLLAAMLPPSSTVLVIFLLFPGLSMFAVYIYAACSAFASARRASPDYILQDYNRAGLYALLIVVHLACPVTFMAGMRAMVFEAFYLPTSSMSPTVVRGDRLLANKLIARDHFPERGDMVVFKNPAPDVGGQVFIKRVVAVAGDTISIDGNQVEINGRPLEQERIPSEALGGLGDLFTGQAAYEFNVGRRYTVGFDGAADDSPASRQELTVPERSVFVMGDNRSRSRDSRHFGPVHVGDIVGYAQYIYWPAGSWSRFGPL